VDLLQLSHILSKNPARLAGLERKGVLAPQMDADVVVRQWSYARHRTAVVVVPHWQHAAPLRGQCQGLLGRVPLERGRKSAGNGKAWTKYPLRDVLSPNQNGEISMAWPGSSFLVVSAGVEWEAGVRGLVCVRACTHPGVLSALSAEPCRFGTLRRQPTPHKHTTSTDTS